MFRPTPRRPSGLRAAALATFLLLVACATSDSGEFKFALGRATPFTTKLIAVYPVALRYEAPAYRSWELAMDEVDATLATGHFLVLGPTEFKVIAWNSNGLFSATNLAGRLSSLGVAPGNCAALRGWIERREQRGAQALYDANGNPQGSAQSAGVRYVIHLELIAPDVQTLIAEAQLELAVDPFADHPPADDAPALRQALKGLVATVFDRAAPVLRVSPQVKELPFPVDLVPWDEEEFALPGRPSLKEQLAGRDPVTVEAARLLRTSYFAPDLSPARQSAMLALPAGLLVRAVPDRLKDSGLQPDDLIVQVEDEPVVGPQTLLRHASVTPAGLPVNFKVRRAGQILPLHLMAPDR